MIIRAKPKFLALTDFDNLDSNINHQSNLLYFNQGRAALLFLLKNLSQFKNKILTVCMQSFNCNVVIEAALQSNCKVILSDISLSDFSIPLTEIKILYSKKKFEVLILTHYQGIPNINYNEIISFCKEKNIICIEDIAQSHESTINQSIVGSLGNFAIQGFTFDKPFSCFSGGSLFINKKVDENIRKFLYQKYQKLETEPSINATIHLDILKIWLKQSNQHLYNKHLIQYNAYLNLLKIFRKQKSIYLFLSNLNTLRKLWILVTNSLNKLYNINSNKITIQKLHPKKQHLIKKQLNKFSNNNQNVIRKIEQLAIKSKLSPINIKNSTIIWNRYSILDPNKKLQTKLQSIGIECGNYNWPTPLNINYKNHKNVILIGKYSNSTKAAKEICNIPTWFDFSNLIPL